jgi:hypothetical protein
MSSSFGSLAFRPSREDVLVPLPAQDYLAPERAVPYAPGGGLLVVDLGGLGARHYDDVIYVLPADAANWRSALGTTAALTVADVSYGSAVLVTLADEQVTFGRDLYAFSARFVIGAVAA